MTTPKPPEGYEDDWVELLYVIGNFAAYEDTRCHYQIISDADTGRIIATLTEPEDRILHRDVRPIVEELSELRAYKAAYDEAMELAEAARNCWDDGIADLSPKSNAGKLRLALRNFDRATKELDVKKERKLSDNPGFSGDVGVPDTRGEL